MTLTIREIRRALEDIATPSFVRRIQANDTGYNQVVGRDYRLYVEFSVREHDPYKDGTRTPITNCPFDFPADVDELRGQVCAAVLMTAAHETIEQVGAGGQHLCDPHKYTPPGNAPHDAADLAQWLALLDSLHATVRNYAKAMS